MTNVGAKSGEAVDRFMCVCTDAFKSRQFLQICYTLFAVRGKTENNGVWFIWWASAKPSHRIKCFHRSEDIVSGQYIFLDRWTSVTSLRRWAPIGRVDSNIFIPQATERNEERRVYPAQIKSKAISSWKKWSAVSPHCQSGVFFPHSSSESIEIIIDSAVHSSNGCWLFFFIHDLPYRPWMRPFVLYADCRLRVFHWNIADDDKITENRPREKRIK